VENRYGTSNIINKSRKVDSNGNITEVSRLSTTFYPNLDTGEDSIIITQPGDRLDNMAKQYYGDETFWFVIAVSNNLGRGSLNIPPGTILRIPRYAEYSGIGALVQLFNSER